MQLDTHSKFVARLWPCRACMYACKCFTHVLYSAGSVRHICHLKACCSQMGSAAIMIVITVLRSFALWMSNAYTKDWDCSCSVALIMSSSCASMADSNPLLNCNNIKLQSSPSSAAAADSSSDVLPYYVGRYCCQGTITLLGGSVKVQHKQQHKHTCTCMSHLPTL